jgi:acyl-coenzyme A synthetase/AMP-(fatty) acid ligase
MIHDHQDQSGTIGASVTLRRALRAGEGLALADQNMCIDWRELTARISRLDESLKNAGVGPRAIVAIPGRSTIAAAAACLGTIATDRCAMLVNPFQPTAAMAEAARCGRPAAMLLEEQDLDDALFDGGDDVLILSADGSARRHGGQGESTQFSDAALILSTSGTTGTPKRVSITDRTLALSIKDISLFNLGFGDRPDATGSWAPLLQYSPLAHIGGALTLLRGAAQARPVVMFDKFDPHRWAEAVAQHRPITTGLPPAMMRMLLDAAIPPTALSSLISVWSGSAPVKPDTATAFTESYGLPVLGNYGATEFCGAVATWSLDDYKRFHAERLDATGRIRPSVAHARVRDPNGGEILALGETGILELRVHRVGSEWLATTDLAHLDADGFLYLHGRADDVIMRGGFKITPDIVIGALRRHPAVRDAAVVGIADRRLGQVPVAVVELRASHRVDETQLISFVRESLPAYFAPTAIRIVSALPRTPAMKIDRGAVRALFDV